MNGLNKCLVVFVLICGGLIGLAADDSNRTIVFLGDSLAAGLGVEREEAFPSIIQRMIEKAGLPYRVLNAGFSGDTTAGGLRRLAWILKRKADIFVLELGGNDGLRGLSPEGTEKNLKAIIDRVRKGNPDVTIILAWMQMPQNMGVEYRTAFQSIFPSVAKEKEVLLIPFLLEGVGGVVELNQADMIHPNVAGHLKVAENVWEVLAPLLVGEGE
jgi:acyl-CoA thioesterase-1